MRNNTSKLQQWLERVWYDNGKGRFLLLPFSALYCAANRYQRLSQTKKRINSATLNVNLKQAKAKCPILVVGNITVGGTGKTPLTIYITKLLQANGYKPGIITRGYGGKSTTWPQLVNANTQPSLAGDEAVLMAKRTHVPVMAGANRLASIKKLQDEHDVNVVISDDGMQHYKMPRDIQIAVIDASRMLGNGLCLPAGPLREKKERLECCDLIVLNGGSGQNRKWFDMALSGSVLVNLKTGQEKSLAAFLATLKGEREDFNSPIVNAMTGIGNPQRFYKTLEQGGLTLQTHSFPDHHAFVITDFELGNLNPILMTEKDAVKCQAFASDKMWYLPIDAVFNDDLDDGLGFNTDDEKNMDMRNLENNFDHQLLRLMQKVVDGQ